MTIIEIAGAFKSLHPMLATAQKINPTFTSSSKKQIIIYGSEDSYYLKIIESLTKVCLEVCCHSDSFNEILEQLPQKNPLCIIVSYKELTIEINELVKIIREFSPITHIIIQVPLNHKTAFPIDNLNVSGVISESANFEEILECMTFILDGLRFVGKNIRSSAVRNSLQEYELPGNITTQERKIIGLINTGVAKNRKLAEILFVSPHTIKNHKDNIVKKLGLNGLHELYTFSNQMLKGSAKTPK